MDSHGKSIKHFQSPMELLCAFRDAIDGKLSYLSHILDYAQSSASPQVTESFI
jgi:hypothetical protein